MIELCIFGHFIYPFEDHEVDESKDGGGNEHEIPEEDVLRVVAGCLSDGGRWERFLLVLRDCFVVSIERGENHDGNIEDN